MKEIGGYIEFEQFDGQEYHEGLIALNCGRNCLAYLIESKQIEKIYIPYLLCGCVSEVCKRYHIQVKYYHIDIDFKPIINFSLRSGEWLYVVNYYGQLNVEDILQLKNKYNNLILDNAQDFFQKPIKGIETIYTCRKFFGVADGAYLSTEPADLIFGEDASFAHMNFLLGRYEGKADEFYNEYVLNNKRFINEPIKKMSKLTHNLLCALNYEKIKTIRTDNFSYLHTSLKPINQLNIKIPNGPFMYPLYIENGIEIRKKLQAQKIYVPTLWPDVFEVCNINDLEYDLAENILPLPIDQRYVKEDINYILCNIYALL